MSDAATITEEVRVLERLDLQALRTAWRKHIGPPPMLRSPDLLRLALAWRMQAAVLGNLDVESRKTLRRSTPPAALGPKLSVGTQLSREWQGVRHDVVVTETGFLHHGVTYNSLSRVARAIAGSRWNGPRFFGLRSVGETP